MSNVRLIPTINRAPAGPIHRFIVLFIIPFPRDRAYIFARRYVFLKRELYKSEPGCKVFDCSPGLSELRLHYLAQDKTIILPRNVYCCVLERPFYVKQVTMLPKKNCIDDSS